MIGRESDDDVWAQSSCRIETCASVIDTNHLGDNDSETNSKGSEKCGFMLFDGKHEDNKDKLCRQKHFEKQTFLINCWVRAVLPCEMLAPPPSLVAQPRGPGISASIMAAAQMAPINCAMQYKSPLRGVIALTMTNANVTAGLNTDPETRKNIQILMIRPIPDDTALKVMLEGSMRSSLVAPGRLATCAPPYVSIKNIVVPTNSPT